MALTKLTNTGAITAALTPTTLAKAISSKGARAGQSVIITDRANGVFVYTEGQTTNGYNIVACTGVTTLALVLKVLGRVDAIQFGAIGDGVTDNTNAFIAAQAVEKNIFVPYTNNSFLIDTPYSLNPKTTLYGDGVVKFTNAQVGVF